MQELGVCGMIRFDPIGRIEIMQQLQVLGERSIELAVKLSTVIGDFLHAGLCCVCLVVAAYFIV